MAAMDVFLVLLLVAGGWFQLKIVIVAGIVGLLFGGPVLHASRGRLSAMVRSLAFRVMGPLLGTLGACIAGVLLLPGHDPTETGVFLVMVGAGLLVGALTGIGADWVNAGTTKG